MCFAGMLQTLVLRSPLAADNGLTSHTHKFSQLVLNSFLLLELPWNCRSLLSTFIFNLKFDGAFISLLMFTCALFF